MTDQLGVLKNVENINLYREKIPFSSPKFWLAE